MRWIQKLANFVRQKTEVLQILILSDSTQHITIKPTSAAVHASVSAVAQAEPVIGANTLIGQAHL